MTRKLIFSIFLILLGASLALGQVEDAQTYSHALSSTHYMILSVVMSFVYLAVYAATIVITLSYLRLFQGFDAQIYLWIASSWLGGMVINYVAYVISPHNRIVVVIIAMPCIFIMSYLLSTSAWGDLVSKDAIRVAIVVALVCTPYFGPTWYTSRTAPPSTPPAQEEEHSPDSEKASEWLFAQASRYDGRLSRHPHLMLYFAYEQTIRFLDRRC